MYEAILIALLIPTDTASHRVKSYDSVIECQLDFDKRMQIVRKQYPAALGECVKMTHAPLSSVRPRARG